MSRAERADLGQRGAQPGAARRRTHGDEGTTVPVDTAEGGQVVRLGRAQSDEIWPLAAGPFGGQPVSRPGSQGWAIGCPVDPWLLSIRPVRLLAGSGQRGGAGRL